MKKTRILAFWPASDFDEFFRPAFLDRDDFEVEIVSGDRSKESSVYKMTISRFFELRKRLRKGEFDIVVSGNVWNSPWPRNKGFISSIIIALRFMSYKRSMLDTWWGPWIMRGFERLIPFIILDLRDTNYILPWDYILYQKSFLYFKRELFYWKDRSLLPLKNIMTEKRVDCRDKLRPLTYGIHPSRLPDSVRPISERDIDVFISGTGNPIREALKQRCLKLNTLNCRVVDKVEWSEYLDLLSRSKLVVCTESYGCETWRQYEAGASGAVPVINWPYVQNLNPYEPGIHALYFSLMGNDFESVILQAFENISRLQKIADAAREHVIKYKIRSKILDSVLKTTLQEWSTHE